MKENSRLDYPDYATLLIRGASYRIVKDPAEDVPTVRLGRQSKVYRFHGVTGDFALKIFLPQYRQPALVGSVGPLARLADWPGTRACHRIVLSPLGDIELLRAHPDLAYAILMPWIEGPSWSEIIRRQQPLEPATCLQLARSFATTVAHLEEHGLAHGDLSGSNLLLPELAVAGDGPPPHPIELIDLEGLNGPTLPRMSLPAGESILYVHPALSHARGTEVDRFAGGLLLCEMLGWCDVRVRSATAGDAYFDPAELRGDAERYRLLHSVIGATWGPALTRNLERVWRAPTLGDCPTFGEWLVALPTSASAQPSLTPESDSDTVNTENVAHILATRAHLLEQRGELADALVLYREALEAAPADSSLAADLPPRVARVHEALHEAAVQAGPTPAYPFKAIDMDDVDSRPWSPEDDRPLDRERNRRRLLVVAIGIGLVGLAWYFLRSNPFMAQLSIRTGTATVTDNGDAAIVSLRPGDTTAVSTGSVVEIGGDSRASFTLPGRLGADLLASTSLSVEGLDEQAGSIAVTQNRGTVRYLLDAEHPADLTIESGSSRVAVSSAGADVILARFADQAISWLAVIDGDVKISRGSDEIDVAPLTSLGLADEEVAPDAQRMDRDSIDRWLQSVTPAESNSSGSAVKSGVLCLATSNDVLRNPERVGGEGAAEVVVRGSAMQASAVDSTGEYVRVALLGNASTGWLDAASIACMDARQTLPTDASVVVVPTTTPTATSVPPTLTPTTTPSSARTPTRLPTPRPRPTVTRIPSTRTPTRRPSVPHSTAIPTDPPTPVPTSTPSGPVFYIEAWDPSRGQWREDQVELDSKDVCTKIKWETANIDQVYLEHVGHGTVPGTGEVGVNERQACIESSTRAPETWILHVLLRDGTWVTDTVTVRSRE